MAGPGDQQDAGPFALWVQRILLMFVTPRWVLKIVGAFWLFQRRPPASAARLVYGLGGLHFFQG